MNVRLDPEDLLRRLTLIARGLGFVFLVYFIPAFLRDAIGFALPGGGFVGALRGDPAGPWLPLLVTVVTCALSVLFVVLYRRAGEGANDPAPLLPPAPRAAREWILGFLAGAVCISVAMIPALLAGAFTIHGFRGGTGPDPLAFAAVAVILLAEAAREELGFRGPAQRDLAHALRPLPAAAFLAGSFALIHRANPAVGWTGLAGIFLAGLALAGVVRARGDVMMACGLHAGWNVMLGLGWSAPVSGHALAAAPLATATRDSWLTGGSFGPEGSVPGLIVLALLAIIAWSRRSGTSSPPAP